MLLLAQSEHHLHDLSYFHGDETLCARNLLRGIRHSFSRTALQEGERHGESERATDDIVIPPLLLLGT